MSVTKQDERRIGTCLGRSVVHTAYAEKDPGRGRRSLASSGPGKSRADLERL